MLDNKIMSSNPAGTHNQCLGPGQGCSRDSCQWQHHVTASNSANNEAHVKHKPHLAHFGTTHVKLSRNVLSTKSTQRHVETTTMVKGQCSDNNSKDTSTDRMELEQGEQKRVCNQPTPEQTKERGSLAHRDNQKTLGNSLGHVGA